MDYKQEIIDSINESNEVFGFLSENLRSDPDIAFAAWKKDWGAEEAIGHSLWANAQFVLDVMNWEFGEFVLSGYGESRQMEGIIEKCPEYMKKAIEENAKLCHESHYDIDRINAVGAITNKGYEYEYTRAIETLEAFVELQKRGIEYNDTKPIEDLQKIQLHDSLIPELGKADKLVSSINPDAEATTKKNSTKLKL